MKITILATTILAALLPGCSDPVAPEYFCHCERLRQQYEDLQANLDTLGQSEQYKEMRRRRFFDAIRWSDNIVGSHCINCFPEEAD